MNSGPDTGRAAGGFSSLYRHGFARVAVAIPQVTVADPASNAGQIIALARQAAGEQAVLTVFPELSLSSYTADDLFHQDALQDAVLDALRDLVAASTGLGTAVVVGAPLRADGLLFNCAVVVCEGTVRGVVPKSYLPSYREFYEKRYFAAARDTAARQVRPLGQDVAFGPDLLFDAEGLEDFRLHVEICEDLWVPVPPSTWAALAGATVLVNLSASNIVIGRAAYRRQLCQSQSARCIAAYLYAASGSGESTTDLAWDGDALVYEDGERLAGGTRFAAAAELVTADIDLQRLAQDRMRMTSFTDAGHDHAGRLAGLRRIPVALAAPGQEARLRRDIPRFPYVPADPADRDERCAEVYHIQVHGLVQRLRAIGTGKVVIGVSGGLDSAHALTVAAESMDRLGLPRRNILAYTMPGFATSEATLDHARQLMTALGATPGEIDIRPSARQMLRDIGHPAADGTAAYDVTYENVQAGDRTSHLFRLAGRHQAIVVGTGDLSELALGWCTFGVGDQMAHYDVNASVPKTLIQHLIRWSVDSGRFTGAAAAALRLVLDTEISPELVPAAHGRLQSSQDVIGRMTCRTSTCTTCCDSATGQAGSPTSPTTHGATGGSGGGRSRYPKASATNTTCRRSRHGWRYSCSVSCRPASSRGPRCPTHPRSAPEDHCRRAVTGVPPATPPPAPGSTNSHATSQADQLGYLPGPGTSGHADGAHRAGAPHRQR